MNRLWSRPWFFPGMGAFLYLTGMNDELIHHVGDWWLDLGRWGQTAAVLMALALAAFFTQSALNRRRSAYRSAVRAADLTRPRRDADEAVATGPRRRDCAPAPTGPTTKGL